MMKKLSKIFSVRTLKELQRGNVNSIRALKDKINRKPDTISYDELFDDALDTLVDHGFRNEYVFKSALINHHRTPESLVLTEFRVNKSVADIIIINSAHNARCFEIKSDHDSLNRLSGQLNDYQKMFSKISLFIDSDKCTALEHDQSGDVSLDSIGIECFRDDNTIESIKASHNNYTQIDKETICSCLRVQELKMILETQEVMYENVPNTQRYAYLMKLICENTDEQGLSELAAQALYRNRYDAAYDDFLDQLPRSLRALALTTKIQKNHQQPIINALRADIN